MRCAKRSFEVTGYVLAVPLSLLTLACGAESPSGDSVGSGSGGDTTGSGGGNTGGSGNNGGNSGGSGNIGGSGGSGNSTSGGTGGSSDPNVLPPPDPARGIQISTPEFVLAPGEELFRCYHVELPSDEAVDVARFVSKMAAGSHHFILYQSDTASAADGTMQERGCSGGFTARWVYASGNVDGELTMPEGVAMPFRARQPLQFDMHYINTTTEDLRAQVTLNLELAEGTFERAASFVSFNRAINIPPSTGGTDGTQTVSGTCTPPAGAKFFTMSTHTHKYATLAQVRRNNATGEELVVSEDWEHPTVGQWDAPNFLTFAAGEQLYYSCSYENPTSNYIRVGTSADTNEMCMAIGYYFPAVTGASCLAAF